MMYTEMDIRLTPDDFAQIHVDWDGWRATIGKKPNFCPPVLDDMMPDINRLVHSVATRFCDQTTPQLQHDELVGQGRLKLAEIITKGCVETQMTREDFFKFFASALNNQARSLVQKYRFTEKRTGVKPPPRTSRVYKNAGPKPDEDDDDEQPREYHKNVELSLNDEELNLQVPDHGSCDEDAAYDELAKDWECLLGETERMVFRAMAHPSYVASQLAKEDACRGKPRGATLRIRITHENLAEAMGMKASHFEEYVLSIRQKIAAYRAMSDTERHQMARRGALLAQLNEVFGLQIPPDTDDMLVRRVLTIAAHDQYQKVKDQPELGEMLEEIGAKVPRILANDSLGCFGVFFQRTCRACMRCDLRKACAVEAANVGLGKIILSPRLLGNRQTRTPVVLASMADETPPEPTPEDLDWLAYLQESFSPVKKRDGCYFHYRSSARGGADLTDRSRPLFFVAAKPPYRLRFIRPSPEMKERLALYERSWYAPERAASVDIQALIDQHADEQLAHHG